MFDSGWGGKHRVKHPKSEFFLGHSAMRGPWTRPLPSLSVFPPLPLPGLWGLAEAMCRGCQPITPHGSGCPISSLPGERFECGSPETETAFNLNFPSKPIGPKEAPSCNLPLSQQSLEADIKLECSDGSPISSVHLPHTTNALAISGTVTKRFRLKLFRLQDTQCFELIGFYFPFPYTCLGTFLGQDWLEESFLNSGSPASTWS